MNVPLLGRLDPPRLEEWWLRRILPLLACAALLHDIVLYASDQDKGSDQPADEDDDCDQDCRDRPGAKCAVERARDAGGGWITLAAKGDR
jgi:hypothetical protein